MVKPHTESIFSDQSTTVLIEDEGAGEFVVISQNRIEYGKIAIDPEEWEMLRAAIDRMIKECRKE